MLAECTRTQTRQEREQRILACAARLPAPPDVVMALINASGEESSGADLIARLVERDPALTTRVLKVANSSFYAMTGRIGTVRDAVVILGFGTVCNIVVAFEITHRYAASPGSRALMRGFWRHAMLSAVCSAALARASDADSGIAFTGGLLHDIGRLVLVSAFPEEFSEITTTPGSEGMQAEDWKDMLDLERRQFGMNHAQIGGWLCEHWRFPGELSGALRAHHDPAATNPLAQLIGHADLIAHALNGENAPARALQAAANALTGLAARESAPELLDRIEQQARAAEQLIAGGA